MAKVANDISMKLYKIKSVRVSNNNKQKKPDSFKTVRYR